MTVDPAATAALAPEPAADGAVRQPWAAYAVSQAGSGIGAGALPLVAILLLNASDWQVSLLAAMAGIAGAVTVMPLGPWVEFRRKRSTMISADLLRCATLASVPVAAWLGNLTFGQLCVVAAALCLLGMAAYIDAQVHAGDPAFAVHRDERHADGYRAAAAYILTHRDDLLDDRDHR